MLYSIPNHTGAYMLIKKHTRHADPVNDTPEERALTKLIGSAVGEFENIPAADLVLFNLSNKYTGEDLIIQLAQEAATIYNADPERVQRAADLARNTFAIQPAKRDANGETITPSYKVLAVKGSKGGWYVVSHGSCTCEDHKRGHFCKHRIAAWMRRETIARPMATARRVDVKTIMQELEA